VNELICSACHEKNIRCNYKKIRGEKSLLKCERCGLYFVWPVPSSDELKQIYAKEYYNAWALNELNDNELALMKQVSFSKILDIISKYKKTGSLLDVGCAFGYLIGLAMRKGWDAYGVETSEYAAKKAMGVAGADRIMVGNFMDLHFSKKDFDAIAMIDAIEHFCNVSSVLKKCKELLKNKGLLLIVTPDMDSVSRRFMGEYWPHFNKEHLMFFSKENAKRILSVNGFKLINVTAFKKAFNFHYIRSQIRAHTRTELKVLIEVVNILIPPFAKKRNFFLPHGEIVIVAQSNK